MNSQNPEHLKEVRIKDLAESAEKRRLWIFAQSTISAFFNLLDECATDGTPYGWFEKVAL